MGGMARILKINHKNEGMQPNISLAMIVCFRVCSITAVLLLLATATKAQSVISALFGRFITLRDSD